MKRTLLTWLTAALAFAAYPPGYNHFTDEQLTGKEQELHGKAKNGLASETLADWGNHTLQAVYRDATGQAEYHEKLADIMMLRKGEGSMLIGGRVIGGKTTAPGEIRGTKIEGGEMLTFKAGDIIHIPPRTPHQVVLKQGQKIDYVLLKVNAQ